MARNADVVLLTESIKYRQRAEALAQRFSSKTVLFSSEREYIDQVESHDKADFIILTASRLEKEQDMLQVIQAIKFIAPRSTLIMVANKKSSSEAAASFKKSGGGLFLFESTFLNESKLDFYYSLNSTGDLIPIKSSEILTGKELPVTILHILPLNKKLLPVIRKGEAVDRPKLQKLNEIGEFYIRRNDLDMYIKWFEKNMEGSSNSIKARCRLQFLNMTVTYKTLVGLMIDQAATSSFSAGKELIEKCRGLARNLISSLSDVGDAWDVINLATFSDFTPLDRSPAIAAYAGFLSLTCNVGDPVDVMICALMADLGLLEFSPETASQFLLKGPGSLVTEDEKKIFRDHPTVGLAVCLDKRLPLTNQMKEIILATHEVPNGKGFPTGTKARIPYEAQLIRFCDHLDNESRVIFGKERNNPSEVRKKMVQENLLSADGTYSPELLLKIKRGVE